MLLVLTFFRTVKEGGGVGANLTDLWSLEDTDLYFRFIFDNMLNLIQIQIMLNMVAGIIIDEFGALKETLSERVRDMREYCFICGLDRDRLERSKNGFDAHYRVEHNMWNYVFYIAYLTKKPETEYTGTESYIYEMRKDMNLDWFPIKK